jgi:hypothetical protein
VGNGSSDRGLDPQRDGTKQSQWEGMEAIASIWTIQVSSTSSVSNSSRPVNDQGIEHGRCADLRAGDTQQVDTGGLGRTIELKLGRPGSLF